MSSWGHSRNFTGFVILVAGAIAASWVHLGHADAPPGRYTISNGTVLDTKTMLTWEQNAPQMATSWPQAQTYCMGLAMGAMGWRLPTMKELQTIVDRTRAMPAIDTNAFPATPNALFWTSSSLAASPASNAWVIKFADGLTAISSKSTPAYVRCVR